jgi:hypothetical protein
MKPIIIIFWILLGLLAAFIAKKKGKNPYFWFGIGLFFGVFGLLALWLIAPTIKKEEKKIEKVIEKPSFFYQEENAQKLWYYVNENKEQIGPIQLGSLETLWEEGKISASTYIWTSDWPSWKKMEDFVTTVP